VFSDEQIFQPKREENMNQVKGVGERRGVKVVWEKKKKKQRKKW